MDERIYKPGDCVGRYEILEHLAAGGFSAIYKARDLDHDSEKDGDERPIALKVNRYEGRTFPPEQRAAYNRRLEREYTLVADLWHRNIIRVFEQKYHEGSAFYAMELLQGVKLGTFLSGRRSTFLELMLIYRQLAGALAFCHAEGVVHRDLTSANVIITTPDSRWLPDDERELPAVEPDESDELSFLAKAPFQPVLLDFGISQDLGKPPLTGPGMIVGTAPYLSPEYARKIRANALAKQPHQAEPHEDVFQFGVLLYQALTGRLPTRTPQIDFQLLVDEICDVEPAHVLEVNPEAPAAFAELAMECLAKDGRDRPRDGAALARRFSAAMRTEAAELQKSAPAPRDGDVSPPEEWTRWDESQTGERAPSTDTHARRDSGMGRRTWRFRERLRRFKISVRFGIIVCLLALLLGVFIGGKRWSVTAQLSADGGLVLTVTPLPVAAELVTAGLPMPEKPRPNWLKPGADGKCRNPYTGEEMRPTSIVRGVCWEVALKVDPKRPCPENSYEAPPEVTDPILRRSCFHPYEYVSKPQSEAPGTSGP